MWVLFGVRDSEGLSLTAVLEHLILGQRTDFEDILSVGFFIIIDYDLTGFSILRDKTYYYDIRLL